MGNKILSFAVAALVAWIVVGSVSACEPGQRLRKARGSHQNGASPWPTYDLSSPSSSHDWGLLYPVEGLTDYNNQCTPSLTADGRTIIFTYSDVNGPPMVGPGICMATWNDTTNSWNRPVYTGLQGSRPFISPDGQKLYYAAPHPPDKDIWVSTWTDSGWSEGVMLPPPVNTPFEETEPGISLDGQRLYFSSDRPGGEGSNDIWVARWNGTAWDSVTNLGPPVNTSFYEGWPRETADGQQLYFGSWDRDLYGWGDLWVSNWTDSGWGEPINLGSPINTELTACSPFVTWDMTKFYCGSEANEGSYGEEDIWVAELAEARSQKQEVRSIESDAQYQNSSWQKTGELAEVQFVYCLLEAFDGVLYAGTYPNGDVFKSTDGGTSWVNTADLPGVDRVYALFQASDSTLYAGTYPEGDVFKTTDGGVSWEATADLEGATSVRCFLQTPDSTLYAGTAPGVGGPEGGGRVFKTTDGGATWDLVTPVPEAQEAVLALFGTDGGTIYAGGLHPQSIARSTDGGTSWTTSPLPYSGDVRCIIQASDGVLWAAGWAHAKGGHVYRSTDNGANWTETEMVMVGEHQASRHYTLAEGPDGAIYTGFQTGPDSVVYKTTDGGQTWVNTGPLSGAREALCLLRASDGWLYAGTTPNGDVFKKYVGMKGDVNCDGQIDVIDAIRTVNIILRLGPPPTEYELWAADMNGDGYINILDVVEIVNEILKG
ncbi:MAG: dockerin type I domain-containing protein [bacterium]